MNKFIVLSILLSLSLSYVKAYGADIEGSKDHPQIGRFDGAEIVAYDKKSFDEMTFLISNIIRREDNKTIEIEGEVTRIMYAVSPDNSVASVFRNYSNSLQSNGFKTVFSCQSKQCGFNFPNQFMLNRSGLYDFSFGNAREQHRYIVAKKTMDTGGDYYVAIMVYNNSAYTKDIRVQVEVVQEEGLNDDQIHVKTANDMAKALQQQGHISLYGIYFDTDKSIIKPNSKPAMDEIAKLLKASPELKVFIVGHTDNKGSVQYNMDLSSQRAHAVKEKLVEVYAIDVEQLGTVGLGFFAPVASNNSQDGQTQNRRVELVEWNE